MLIDQHLIYLQIRGVFRQHGVFNGIFTILMLHMSSKITKDLRMAPGGEFRRAFDESQQLPYPVMHLGDRDINITLQRAFNGLTLWQTFKIFFKFAFSNDKITPQKVESCKNKDLLEEILEKMGGEYPVFHDVFLTERDKYMTHSLQLAARATETVVDGRPVRVVGIVGIGHLAGIAKNWGKVDDSEIPDLLTVPPKPLSVRLFSKTVKYGVIAVFSYSLFKLIRLAYKHPALV